MELAAATVLPVFGLILLGWVTGWRGWLDAPAVRVLNIFVMRLALPIWMFHFVATADWADLWQPGFVAASAGGVAIAFSLTLLTARRGTPLGERSIQGITGAYANTLFMGLPIGGALFGTIGTAAAAIASLLTIGLLFAIGVMLMEYEAHRERGMLAAAAGVAGSTLRNPMVFAPLLGALWAVGGIALPTPVDRFAALLGAAASPVALVAIGLFLAHAPKGTGGGDRRRAEIVLIKLIVQPIATAGLAWLLAVPRTWALAAILIAALPTGTGPFMLAELYRRQADQVARAIFLSTLVSAGTLSAFVWLLGKG